MKANPVDIRFGVGALDRLGALLAERSCLLIASEGQRRRRVVARIEHALRGRVRAVHTHVTANPTLSAIGSAFEELAPFEADVIVAVGGGSVIDTAKAIAAERGAAAGGVEGGYEPGWLVRHLRDGEPFPLAFRPPAIFAVPTTAGSGSEVTCWATVWDEKPARKHSLSHASLYPEWAIVDPQLTLGMPEAVGVAGALDAFSHAVESLWSRHADPVSLALASRAVPLIVDAVRGLLEAHDAIAVRSALQEGALLAGLASSRTRTGLAHSISYPFTAELGLAHGLACSFALPELLERNAAADPAATAPAVRALGADDAAIAVATVDRLYADLRVAERIAAQLPAGFCVDDLSGPLYTASRADNNPVAVDEVGARELAAHALERLGLR